MLILLFQFILQSAAFFLGAAAFLYEIGIKIDDPAILKKLHILEIIAASFIYFDIFFQWIRSWHKADFFKEKAVSLSAGSLGLLFLALYFLDIIPFSPWLNHFRWAVLLILLTAQFIRFNLFMVRGIASPAWNLLSSFLIVIIIGTLLLSLPNSVPDGQPPLNLHQALFMATSATCVTGLSIVSLNDLSFFGQITLLSLIQLGGLGLLTFIAVFSLRRRKGLGLRQRVALQDALNTAEIGEISYLIKLIILFTLFFEGLGALLLHVFWKIPEASSGQNFYHSVFHAVSAFCNAGFSLHDTSLAMANHETAIKLIIASLVIVGGLGFIVLMNLYHLKFPRQEKTSGHLILQSKMVLWGTAFLLVAGFAVFWYLEKNNPALMGSSWQRITSCFFQSVTLRTAGFSTLDFATLKNTTLLFCISFMLIGGGPGGTAGGLKISTLMIMVSSILSTARGQKHVSLFRRRLSEQTIKKALVVMTIFALGFFLTSACVFITDGERFDALDLLFEIASAYATVGLSTGITEEISREGQSFLMLAMLLGRIGPLTMVLAMGHQKSNRFIYPSENVMIG
jgi:trk system potassium uptake protein TrkH